MKIQLLKKREEFNEIFHTSVAAFIDETHSQSTLKKRHYLVNERLNIIYPCDINRSNLNDLVSEFKYHKLFYKHILQSLFVFLAIRPPFELLLSSKKISFFLPIENSENWVFIPGNHSIRLVDIASNTCHVFLKSGFNPEFLRADAETRLSNPWLLSPEVTQFQHNWYQEKRIIGLPLNRLPDKFLAEKVFVRATAQLSKLYSQSPESLSAVVYMNKLCDEIFSLLDGELSTLDKDSMECISMFVACLKTLLLCNFGSKRVTIVRTHGDFQPGNILCADERFWIIDWEYSQSRSIFYDALVYDLKCRSPLNLSDRVAKTFKHLKHMNGYLSWTGQILNVENMHYFLVFFIEDMLVRLKENAAKPIFGKSQVLRSYLDEIVKITAVIERQSKSGFFLKDQVGQDGD